MSKVAKIFFDNKDLEECIVIDGLDIVQALYCNGQILKEYIIEESKNNFEATVTLTSQNALDENGYDFKMYDGLFRICIRGSICLLYLTQEDEGVFVNKRLCRFQALDKEIFEREKVILSNLERRGLHISPKIYPSTDSNVIKIEKCAEIPLV